MTETKILDHAFYGFCVVAEEYLISENLLISIINVQMQIWRIINKVNVHNSIIIVKHFQMCWLWSFDFGRWD